jgi:hypothetical protein
MFRISAIGPDGHTIIIRKTPSEAFRKAVELAGAGFGNVRIADRTGLLHAPETFERFFIKRASHEGSRAEGTEFSHLSPCQELFSC